MAQAVPSRNEERLIKKWDRSFVVTDESLMLMTADITVAYSATFARRTTQHSRLSFESKWNTETTRISIWIENKIYYPKAVFYLNTCRLQNPLNRDSAFENPNWIQIKNSNWKKSPNGGRSAKKRRINSVYIIYVFIGFRQVSEWHSCHAY